ncbi:MAG: cupredoxin domain-containing protein [Actinomycetota bacterium]
MSRAARGAMILALLLSACTDQLSNGDRTTGSIRTVAIDAGGTGRVVSLESQTVEASPGDTVRIEHRGALGPGDTGVLHALVAAAAEEIPPLFVPAAGGAVANGGVWGPCRGGRVQDAGFGCPVLPVEGPAAWNGSDYWATGAMVPGERRDVPLSSSIPPGAHTFVCAFHPALQLEIRVTTDPEEPSDLGSPGGGNAEPLAEPSLRDAVLAGDVVLAGLETSDPPSALNAFMPNMIRVAAGAEVIWKVASRDPHEVVFSEFHRDLLDSPPVQAVPSAPAGPWDGSGEVWSGFLSTDPSAPGGRSFSLSFAKPGRFEYFCLFHGGMRGAVVVGPRRAH